MRKLLILAWTLTGIGLTYYCAYLLRFDRDLGRHFISYQKSLPILIFIVTVVFLFMGQFSGLWRYYSINDLWRTVLSCFIAVGAFGVFYKSGVYEYDYTMSRMVIILEFILFTGWCTGSRAFIRLMRERRRKSLLHRKEYISRVLICGKVDEADLLLRACSNDFEGIFCGIYTEELNLHKGSIHGVPIFSGKLKDVTLKILDLNITDIHLMTAFNSPAQLNLLLDECAKAGVAPKFHTIPALKDFAAGDITASLIRDVGVKDLLGREPANLDRRNIRNSIQDKKILITGAGGSIGAEICRQILTYKPVALVLFEFSEIALYTVEKELREWLLENPENLVKIYPIAGDIRHEEEVEAAIDLVGGIDLIYHAAAYKHVPLMEENVSAALRNNVLGTARLARVAERKNVKRLVMISSDKAVRPSNIMGATKRIAERVLQERAEGLTEFVAVRFGNVLGSSGSVIPLFKRRIREGKVIQVTSPEMRRFFMTIPEACDLVLMSGAVADPGQIMVLEMGEPVKIYDLAIRLIELSGLKPNEDVKIEFSGLRPGEKEYEEILTEDENVIPTEYERIWTLQKNSDAQRGIPVDLTLIAELIKENNDIALRALVKQYVPENTFKGGDIKGMPNQLLPENQNIRKRLFDSKVDITDSLVGL